MLKQTIYKNGDSVEIYAIYPKKKLDTETLEYMQAWFYRKIKLTLRSDSTLLTITKYPNKRITFHVSRRWKSFLSGEPLDDWFTHELLLTKEACEKAQIQFESDKEKRIEEEDINDFITKLEREGKIWTAFGSEHFEEQHV